MKVEINTLSDEQSEEIDYRQSLEIKIDGKSVFNVLDGEPEDANLSRDFCDIYNIGNLLKLAYEAGQRGEDFEIINGFQADF